MRNYGLGKPTPSLPNAATQCRELRSSSYIDFDDDPSIPVIPHSQLLQPLKRDPLVLLFNGDGRGLLFRARRRSADGLRAPLAPSVLRDGSRLRLPSSLHQALLITLFVGVHQHLTKVLHAHVWLLLRLLRRRLRRRSSACRARLHGSGAAIGWRGNAEDKNRHAIELSGRWQPARILIIRERFGSIVAHTPSGAFSR